MQYNLIGFSGIFILMSIAWAFSTDRRNVNWRAVFWGIALQLIFAVFIFIIPTGQKVFLFINDAVIKIFSFAQAGTRFVFGRLAISPGEMSAGKEESLGFILAFQGFPTIIFFSSLMSILYFFNIMPRIIGAFARTFTRMMKISGAESMVASSNIFVGVESALTVRPYLKDMTRSELCTVLTAGMATVASNIMAVYVFSLRAVFPNIAGHLISASILSAPAAIVMSKLLLPENESPKTMGTNVEVLYDKDKSLFEAVINGATAGARMIVGITALLIAVLGLAALCDGAIGFMGAKINVLAGWHIEWSLKALAGYLFYPLTLILGIPPQDAGTAARLIGERLILTEVTAYQDLAVAIGQKLISARSALITTYALCGFAHLASMAIFVGGVSTLVPEKMRVVASVAVRALVAATLACLMTAAVASTFAGSTSILFGK